MRGTQSLERATEVLKQISRFGTRGTTLTVLATSLELPNSTCHRLLGGLVEVGLAHFDGRSKMYRVGPLAFELGMVAVSPLAQLDRCRPVILDVARKTEDTAYLMYRRGADIVCLAREEGSYVIKANVVEVGGRRPVCDSVAGIAMLATMPPEDAAALVEASRSRTTRGLRLPLSQINDRIRFAQQNGIAYWLGVVMPDVVGAAVAVTPRSGMSYVSVAISAMQSRLPEGRLKSIKKALLDARDEMEALM